MHQEGLDHLIAYYPNRLKQIKEVYRQEVLKIEHKNSQDRRVVSVVKIKLKDYNDQRKTRYKVEKRGRIAESTLTSTLEINNHICYYFCS